MFNSIVRERTSLFTKHACMKGQQKSIVQNFYDSLARKDDEWQKNLSEGVVFSDASKRLHAEGKNAFIQSFTAFLKSVEHVQAMQLIVERDDACAVVGYD